MGFFSIDLKNQMLNAIAGISPVLWIQKVSFNAANNSTLVAHNTPTFNIPANTTVKYIGYWSASGVFLGSEQVTEKHFTTQSRYQLISQTIQLSNLENYLQTLSFSGISSFENFGSFSLSFRLTPQGIVSSENFGNASCFETGEHIVSGITTEEVFGIPEIIRQAGNIVYDDFNRSNGDIGNNWDTISDLTKATIYNNRIASVISGARWVANSFGPDQFACVKVITPASTFHFGPAVRISSTEKTYYAAGIIASWDYEESTWYYELNIWKYVNGNFSIIVSNNIQPVAGYYVLEANGTTISLKYHASDPSQATTILSVQDSSISSGDIGFVVAGTGEMDDFSGGEL